MQTVGDYLKKGREARNISLSEASHYTKISTYYLDCLEKDEYAKLPEGPYIKGYIASYATFLGLNENEAFKRYDSVHLEKDKTEEIPPGISEVRKRPTFSIFSLNKKNWLVLSFSVLLLFTVGIYYSFFQSRKNSDIDNNRQKLSRKMQSAITSKTESDFSQHPLIHSTPKTLGLEKTETHVQREAAIDTSDRENIPSPERSDSNRVDQIKFKPAQRQSDPSLAGQSLQPEEGNKSESYQTHFENNIKVIEATACHDIKDRNPLGSGDSFEWSKDRIYIWSSLECERPPSSIRHIYYFDGEKVADILLEVRSSRWRTWSYKNILNKLYVGPWRVDITLADGKLLQSINFEIR